MDTMETEALRRARDMQRGIRPNQNPPQPQPKKAPEPAPLTDAEPPKNAPVPFDASKLFEDKEKLLILLLIMVLSEESTNLELVLALLLIMILSSEEGTDPVLILALLYVII